tara:strand:- start:1924 stop:2466 length:543 start_codon:yes stop_codon:yes gene_type:complete
MREKIDVFEGDITSLDVDVIVNAANNALLGGAGVDGAIHRAAGPGLLEECRELGGCETGDARITGGYGLQARHVIHTVGPVWHGGGRGEAQLLASCYRCSFRLVDEAALKSIAFPAISAGVYGYPFGQAARIAVHEAKSYLEQGGDLERLVFACFGAEASNIYLDVIDKAFGGSQSPKLT